MKAILVIFLISTCALGDILGEYECKNEILQFYGLSGSEHSTEPIHYQSIRNELGFDACPGIEYSCCTITDYEISKKQWDMKADTIKRYLTKLFRIIQKTTVLQGSLLEMANIVRSRDNKYCKEIDSTFFQKAIQFDEIYFYLQNSLNAFAFMQRGFYCTVCDAKNHQYLGLKSEHTPGVRTAVVNVKFCNDLIYFFREFIMFKVFYIDPMIINTNFLFNCYENTDKYKFDFNYKTTYNTIENCVEKGEGCEFVCKEFKMGTASDLFIGRLNDYHEFFNNLERIITKFNPSLRNDFENEIVVEDELYPDEFFVIEDPDRSQEEHERLKEYDLSTFNVKIEESGINLFDISAHSNYYLTSAHLRDNVNIQSANTSFNMPGGSSFQSSMTGAYSNISAEEAKKEQEWEEQHEAEKMEQDPNSPSKAELASLLLERDNLENDFAGAVNTRGTVDYEAGSNTSNFSAVSKIPNGSNVGIVSAILIGMISVLLN